MDRTGYHGQIWRKTGLPREAGSTGWIVGVFGRGSIFCWRVLSLCDSWFNVARPKSQVAEGVGGEGWGGVGGWWTHTHRQCYISTSFGSPVVHVRTSWLRNSITSESEWFNLVQSWFDWRKSKSLKRGATPSPPSCLSLFSKIYCYNVNTPPHPPYSIRLLFRASHISLLVWRSRKYCIVCWYAFVNKTV